MRIAGALANLWLRRKCDKLAAVVLTKKRRLSRPLNLNIPGKIRTKQLGITVEDVVPALMLGENVLEVVCVLGEDVLGRWEVEGNVVLEGIWVVLGEELEMIRGGTKTD